MPPTTPRPTPPTAPAADVGSAAGPTPVGARAHTGVVGDDAMAAATGHARAHWFGLLDAEGATAWRHRDIALWLVRTHGVDAWWSQGITVGYEQARGMRAPGQRQDGSFESSSSRTVPVDVAGAYRLVADPDVRGRWLDVPVDVTGATVDVSVRWTMPDGSRAVVRVQAVRPGATRVAVQHGRLADAGAVTASKSLWAERLARMAEVAVGD